MLHKINDGIHDIHELKERYRRIYYLVGTPYHSNIGDRAIALSEIEFLMSRKLYPVIEVPYGTDLSSDLVGKNDVIILHGGGNFGDIWFNEEEYRRDVIDRFSDNKMVLMPQTIFFQDKKELDKSSKIYSKAKDLTLITREETSYNIAKENFSNNVLLTPDIVLSLKKSRLFSRIQSREYALIVARADKERTISDDHINVSVDVLRNKKNINKFIFSDMHVDEKAAGINTHDFIVNKKIDEFLGAKVVITDRLHGMIFALLTNTPCIVFGSQTYKTSGVFEWIKKAGYESFIKYYDGGGNLDDFIDSIDLDKKYRYSSRSFKSYWKMIEDLL